MLERHFTAERLNEIANHPTIYPWIKGAHEGNFDLTNIVKNKNNICLVGEYGSVIFIKHQLGIYEYHCSVLPEGRGKWMLDGSKSAFRWMFTKTDAFELMTKCPDGNIASKAGARAVGCFLMFRTRPIWPTEKGLVSVDVWSVILQNWVKQTLELAEVGQKFHDLLEEKYKVIGKQEQIHSEDPVHNQYVGATVEMLLNGQALKGILAYNRWAIMSGYKRISLISLEPLIIDIWEARLKIENGDFEVLDNFPTK